MKEPLKRPKYGGRKKGSLNVITLNTRELINQFLENNFGDVQDNYDALDPRDKLAFLLKIMEFTTPRLKAIEMTTVRDQKIDQLNDAQIDQMIENLLNNNENE